MKTSYLKSSVAMALGALALGAAFAKPATNLPAVQQAGSISYLSGGIGLDEAKAIEKASPKWPLTMEFAVKDRKHDDFTADVAVTVRDQQGKTEMAVTANGPFLLAQLKPGDYEVDATYGGKTLHEKVHIKDRHPSRTVFVWPAGTGEHRS